MMLSAYYLDGRTLAEIARMLGVHESTISRKLDKLAKSLRKQIIVALGSVACLAARPRRPWRSTCAICRWIFAAAWRKRRLRRSQRREWRPGSGGRRLGETTRPGCPRHGGATRMEKLPKIVGERLRAAAVAVDHPDPDVLTAFSERSLPEHERSQVLAHLTRCGDCRDVLALSLTAEEPSVAVIRPIRGRWLTWPRLRWGLVAAGVIVVGSFGALRYRETSHPAMVASYDAPRAQGIANEAKTQAEPSPVLPKAAQVDEQKKTPQGGLLYDQTQSAPETDKEFDRSRAVRQVAATGSGSEAGRR